MSQDDMVGATGGLLPQELRDATAVGYERPRLTPMGSLHDLLAGGSGSTCDVGGDPGFAGENQCA
jgi:hypothetical protein